MSIVLGIDPGAKGAFAMYDTVSRTIAGRIEDMPTWYQLVGKKKRLRIDAVAVMELAATFEMIGVELAVMEAVGGRGNQPGSSGFVFGYGVGLVYMSLIASRIPIETVAPQTWKRLLNVPGKEKADDTAILARADEMFPEARAQFRGPRGGKMLDRAEAAMLARYGADHILPNLELIDGGKVQEDIYRRADTGA